MTTGSTERTGGEPVGGAIGAPRWSLSAVPLAAGTLGIVLAPYATTTLPHRQALVVQAAAILACTAVAAVGVLSQRGWWQRLAAAPRALRIGVTLYAAAALHAALQGVWRGNELTLLAGQLLSMGLLPLGFVAAASNPSPRREAVVAWSLAAASGVACLLHFAHWGFMAWQGHQLYRLFMGNSVSLTGVSLLALLVALALAASQRGWRRRLALALAGLVALFIVGSATRSLWLASLLGLALLALAGRVWRVMAEPGVRRASFGLLLLLAVAAAAGTAWWRAPRRNLLPDAETLAPPVWRFERGSRLLLLEEGGGAKSALSWDVPARKGLFLATQPLWLEGGRLYRFSLQARSEGAGAGRFGLVTRLDPRAVCKWWLERLPADPTWRRIQILVSSEHDLAVQVILGTEEGASGTWAVKDVRLEALPVPAVASLHRQLDYLGGRLRSTLDIFEKGPEEGDESAAFRLKETLAVWRQFRRSGPVAQLLGHGLGARYGFRAWGWSDTGERVFVEHPNYIHNFYAFLLFKTGVVGTAAVLAALALWLAALRRAVREAGETASRWLATAVGVALAAYVAWSLVCPEILDFRVAPLWGLLLGTLPRHERTP